MLEIWYSQVYALIPFFTSYTKSKHALNVFCYPYTLGDNEGRDIDGITDVKKVEQSNSSALVEVEDGWQFKTGKLSKLTEEQKLDHYSKAQQIIKARYQVFLNIVFE